MSRKMNLESTVSPEMERVSAVLNSLLFMKITALALSEPAFFVL